MKQKGWETVCISGSQSQTSRLKTIECLKEFRCRILVSTDLTSRGIDAENVNLIINLDLPYDGSTYMHRIGRAGRFGTQGVAVTIVQNGSECQEFQKMLYQIGGRNFSVFIFPKEGDDVLENLNKAKDKNFKKLESLEGEYKFISLNKKIFEETTKKGDGGRSENLKEDKNETQTETKMSNSNEDVSNLINFCFKTFLVVDDKPKLRNINELKESKEKYLAQEKDKEMRNDTEDVVVKNVSQDHVDLLHSCYLSNWKKYEKDLESNLMSKNETEKENISTKNDEEECKKEKENKKEEWEVVENDNDEDDEDEDDSVDGVDENINDENFIIARTCGNGNENVDVSEENDKEIDFLDNDELNIIKENVGKCMRRIDDGFTQLWYKEFYRQAFAIQDYVNYFKNFQI